MKKEINYTIKNKKYERDYILFDLLGVLGLKRYVEN